MMGRLCIAQDNGCSGFNLRDPWRTASVSACSSSRGSRRLELVLEVYGGRRGTAAQGNGNTVHP